MSINSTLCSPLKFLYLITVLVTSPKVYWLIECSFSSVAPTAMPPSVVSLILLLFLTTFGTALPLQSQENISLLRNAPAWAVELDPPILGHNLHANDKPLLGHNFHADDNPLTRLPASTNTASQETVTPTGLPSAPTSMLL